MVAGPLKSVTGSSATYIATKNFMAQRKNGPARPFPTVLCMHVCVYVV